VARLAAEIGLRDIRFVANKVASLADEQYIRTALVGQEVVGVIPWSEEIRSAERQGRPVTELAGGELLRCFDAILQKLQAATLSEEKTTKHPPKQRQPR
jgi:CO dehydrogenase nickel-insertion accessory protein CooC1